MRVKIFNCVTMDINEDYKWPSILITAFESDFKEDGPIVDEGCVEPSQAGYSMVFTNAATA
jgi:hypothetical protein